MKSLRSKIAVCLVIIVAAFVVWFMMRSEDAPRDHPRGADDVRSGPPPMAHGFAPDTRDARDDAVQEEALGEAPSRDLALVSATVVDAPASLFGAISGRVLSESTHEPIARAQVSFARAERSQTVQTDERGEFLFEPTEAGTYELAFVQAEDFLSYAPEWGHSPISFRASPRRRIENVTVYLSKRQEYLGVVREGETPIAGAHVRVFDDADAALDEEEREFITDDRGEFRFSAHDGAVVQAEHPAHGRIRRSLDLSAQIEGKVVLDFGASATGVIQTGAIQGAVIDPAGEPVAGAVVRARCELRAVDRAHRANPTYRATTNVDGSFEVSVFDDCSYTITSEMAPFVEARVRRIRKGASVELRFREGAALRGHVRREDGAPIAAFSLAVQDVGRLNRRMVAVKTIYDANGMFEIGGLAPGEYAVTVAASGYAPTNIERVQVPREGLEVRLSSGAMVRGIVVERDTNEPIPNARVLVEGGLASAGSSLVPFLSQAVTGPDGTFELLGVPPGRQSITVSASGHDARILSALDASPAAPLVLRVDLARVEPGGSPKLEMTGIGAVLTPANDTLVVGQTLDGGGASEAGLKSGDRIVAVDGVAVSELGFDGSIQRIRGPEGSSVALTIRRNVEESEEPREEQVIVRRRRIRT